MSETDERRNLWPSGRWLVRDRKKKELIQHGRDEVMKTARTKLLEELHKAGKTGTSQ